MHNFLILLLSLLLIIFSSSLFCNALEHLGEKLGISEGVTGSIFAAVGTALPETIIPILAVLSPHNGNTNAEIGIGAILGAPLMLSTLSLFVMAASILYQRGLTGRIAPEPRGLQRDLKYFLFGYGLAFIAIFVQSLSWHSFFNFILIIALGLSYFIYLLLTIKDSAKLVESGHTTTAGDKLFLQHFGLKVNKYSIFLQLIFGLLILIYCAEIFIEAINSISTVYNISAFIISLIIIPIATELPEKINSVLWIRKGKDTLAIGNITGAMVFQGTLLPIVGIIFTDWTLTSPLHLASIILTVIATGWLYWQARRQQLQVWHLGINGLLYLINLAICAYFFKG
jgi:cation:H+ antiporter